MIIKQTTVALKRYRGSARGSHRTKLWGRLFGAQISAKMEKMKSGTGRERPCSKKPKKAETEGKRRKRKKVGYSKRNPIKKLRKQVVISLV